MRLSIQDGRHACSIGVKNEMKIEKGLEVTHRSTENTEGYRSRDAPGFAHQARKDAQVRALRPPQTEHSDKTETEIHTLHNVGRMSIIQARQSQGSQIRDGETYEDSSLEPTDFGPSLSVESRCGAAERGVWQVYGVADSHIPVSQNPSTSAAPLPRRRAASLSSAAYLWHSVRSGATVGGPWRSPRRRRPRGRSQDSGRRRRGADPVSRDSMPSMIPSVMVMADGWSWLMEGRAVGFVQRMKSSSPDLVPKILSNSDVVLGERPPPIREYKTKS
ncbi:hypothetical protein C8R43DRAFT_1192490 [Mycena crocata]|nr:hypothetical protein C8R43DRAFT_1192490 [Mycena crocata]